MENTEKLYNAITNIDDKYIEEAAECENAAVRRAQSGERGAAHSAEAADRPRRRSGGRRSAARRIAAAAVCAACAALAVGIAAFGIKSGTVSYESTESLTSDVASSSEIYEYGTATYGSSVGESLDSGEDSAAQEAVNAIDSAQEGETAESSRKLITTMTLDMETLDFDNAVEEIEKKAEALGGYVENSYIYNGSGYSSYKSSRYADLTLRIPEDELDDFVNSASALCNVTGKSQNVEDVTLTYIDLESRKTALETEQETLLSLMEKAETVEEIIAIESQLTEVRYQLEYIESQLRTYDNKINYSTVYVYLSEVKDLTDTTEAETFGEKISKGFAASIKAIGKGIENFAAWVVINLPYIILIAILAACAVLIVLLILRGGRRGKNKTRENERK